ncbi:MAG: GNAT family N-acetyltransferase [Candidatus Aenigmatarchaeota archaeon]
MFIRPAVSTDIEAIQELDKESTTYHRKFDRNFYMVSEKWWKIKRNFQLAAMKDSKNLILVAEDNDEIVGYVWGYVERLNKYNIGKIQELVVSIRHRRKGIGTRLVKSLLEFFKSKNCIIVEVLVNVKNIAAYKTYKNLGFEEKEYRMQAKIDKTRKFRPFV